MLRTIEINNAELISPCKEEITVHIKDIFNDWDNWEEKHQFVEDEVDGEYEQYSLDLRFYNIEKGVSKLFKATEIERSLDANGELIPYEWDAIFELDINDVDQTGTYFIDYVYSDRL